MLAWVGAGGQLNTETVGRSQLYKIVFFLSTAGYQVLIRVADPSGFIPFSLAAVSSLLAAALSNFSPLVLVLFVGLYIGLGAAIYPIAVAITNDLIENHQVTAACTALLLSYGLGSIIEPLVSALFMELLGDRGLFISNALALGG